MGGMGFGVIAGVVAFSNVLKESGGPGIVGVNGGSQFFVLTSGMVHLYIQYRGNFIIYITKLFGVLSISSEYMYMYSYCCISLHIQPLLPTF